MIMSMESDQRRREGSRGNLEALQVNAAALNPEILEPLNLGTRVERKQPTVPVSFKTTEIVIKKSVVLPLFPFMAKPRRG